MTLNEEQLKELLELAKPLMAFLDKHCHPHCEITITSLAARLSEDVAYVIEK